MPDNLDPEIKKELKKEDLCYCSDQTPGFFRQKFGDKFKYYDIDGKTVKSKKILVRIEKLVIPPAWENVWICPKVNGHLQATGIDEKGRKQYIYHPNWIKISQENKFDKIVDFGKSLPKIRQRVSYYLEDNALDKRKILATVVWLLEHTFIRVGNEEYSKENESFGLTTLRNRHVKVRGSRIFFSFVGKSGKFAEIEISNPKIAKTIRRCIELPGYELFKFVDDDGEKHTIDSEDVNLFLKEVTDDDFSAKDFRTWGATSICAKNFYKLGPPDNKKLLKKNISNTVRFVANHLNNTVSVCRNYYIHPAVIKAYQENVLIPHFENYSRSKKERRGLSWNEYALIKLLQKNSI